MAETATRAPLGGMGVVVTRPEQQAGELVAAVEAAGGKPWRFPVMEILPRDPEAVRRDLTALGESDVVVFVSANAVRYGLDTINDPKSRVAAIGPATAAALEARGVTVDVTPAGGFTSEHLLADPALAEVSGKRITIVRGDSGRDLLARSLRRRGAEVNYLPVYRTRAHRAPDAETRALKQAMSDGRIGAVTIMSTASFENLAGLLGREGDALLAGLRLVAPGARVIKTLAQRLPGARCVEARGPGAQPMVDALIASLQTQDQP